MVKYNKLIKNIFIITLFSLIIFKLASFTINTNYLNFRNSDYKIDGNNRIDIKAAQFDNDALNYSAIYRNDTILYRLFDSIKFEVNISGFNDVDHTYMQIDFSNNSIGHYNMTLLGNGNYSYIFSPKWNAPLGFQNVSFLIYDASNELLNAHTTYTNFTIKSNYLANLNSTEYNRGDIVYAEFIVNNYSIYEFNWNITIVDNPSEDNQINLFHLGNNIQQVSFQIDDRFTQPDKIYYIKINMSDDSPSKKVAAYVPFKVLNSVPQIIISSINFSSKEFKRAEDCTIRLNVSDADPNATAGYVNVSLILITSTGEREAPIQLSNNEDWTFDKTFSIDIDKPIGLYQAILKAKDQYSGIYTYNTTLTIKNNYPKIHNFWINGKTIEESIAINYGENLVFTFNISDIENMIAYVTVSLLDENDNWYNISKSYSDSMNLTIRSVDLITGVWYVYLSVTDEDGDTTYITSDFALGPKEIRIIPDAITPILPWITLILGLIFGILGGIAFSYRRVKSKYVVPRPISPKKKAISLRKEKAKAPKEELEKERIEETKPEEEPEKKPLQRKIKRKLK